MDDKFQNVDGDDRRRADTPLRCFSFSYFAYIDILYKRVLLGLAIFNREKPYAYKSLPINFSLHLHVSKFSRKGTVIFLAISLSEATTHVCKAFVSS